MKNFKKLNIWILGMEIVKQTFEVTSKLPKEEKYGAISQMTRAAVSIPANIAEGGSRSTDKAYARFITFSLGSAFELETFLIISKELNWLKAEETKELEENLQNEIIMLQAFLKKLKQ